MSVFKITFLFLIINYGKSIAFEDDMTYKVDPGVRTCFFENAKKGQMLEVHYQVTDGQHGDLDISFDIIDPNGEKLASDNKKEQNSIIRDILVDGEYVFCLDNSHSIMNTKTVFVYILIEDENLDDATVSIVEDDKEHIEVLEWMGHYPNGEPYYIEVNSIANAMTKVLKHVVKSRHLLDMYAAMKSKDGHLVEEDTFVVDLWSGFQICFMLLIGTIQVFMIKKLFRGVKQTI